ncbi:Similar to mRNA export protein mlo3; acc. no. Q09330 [Pyronema omphalodes CBS 100304]|uniref:Similar to mRNA export protein mlo3 acc. no. Q09330 n=1 Tax=Pyronema omphalodes (strain CBS 100304) TaxID=1076935 RepID=U4LCV3_PYROM|nr:Similar to mRNA export protein mlo3; acc. no. Q09330 [Pyronema omphalodes CBS 100304]
MSANLDHSLDEIIASRPRGAPRRGGKPATASPAGGVRKRSSRVAAQKANVSVAANAAKAAPKSAPTGPSSKSTKIIVSNLPKDVSEHMIKVRRLLEIANAFSVLKEYFQSVVGPIKRALLTYGPDGKSRGVATIEFQKASDATLAASKYNGVDVDNRPMKVELVVDPNAPATFAERVGQPNKLQNNRQKAENNRPKPAAKAAPKPAANARGGRRGPAAAGAAPNQRGAKGGRSGSGRAKPKTAEELDQEMSDYFGGAGDNSATAAPAATNGAATGGDVGMDDTVL